MCRRDWYLVPYALRGRIWATWRSGEAAFSSEHQAAVHEAIAFAQAATISVRIASAAEDIAARRVRPPLSVDAFMSLDLERA
jgi:hypothetical protein